MKLLQAEMRSIKVDTNRKDELGILSVAFQKMVSSIQDKEQDLLAHNEELSELAPTRRTSGPAK